MPYISSSICWTMWKISWNIILHQKLLRFTSSSHIAKQYLPAHLKALVMRGITYVFQFYFLQATQYKAFFQSFFFAKTFYYAYAVFIWGHFSFLSFQIFHEAWLMMSCLISVGNIICKMFLKVSNLICNQNHFIQYFCVVLYNLFVLYYIDSSTEFVFLASFNYQCHRKCENIWVSGKVKQNQVHMVILPGLLTLFCFYYAHWFSWIVSLNSILCFYCNEGRLYWIIN